MSIIDRNRIFDGFDSMEGGVDAGRRANVIGVNQAVSAENVSFRGGIPTTRPGIRKLTHAFTNPNLSYLASGSATPNFVPGLTSAARFGQGVFQAACYYTPRGGEECIMAMIDGRLFRLVPRDYTVDVTEIALPQQNRPKPEAWMVQADKWLVVQDGESLPILFDGSIARRSRTKEVPVGEIMAYGMGRLVVTHNGQSVTFGDLYGSHEGLDPGDSVIQFTETTFLTEGFDASIPSAMGKITGAAFFPQLDTSTGTGELFVFTDRGASSFFLSIPRDQWKTSAFQKIALINTGLRGWRSISAVNEDLWFRASDGARTFRQARSEPQGWYHLPLSTNVKQWLDHDTPELLDFSSAIYFDNRVILTTSPIWNQGRVYHNGFVVLDFDILSSFGTNSRPAWNGHFSKLRTTQLVTGTFSGRRRALAFGLDGDNLNQLYEITGSDKQDFDGPINGELICRSFDFARDQASNPFSEKELYGGDVWVNNVNDPDALLSVFYRPDDYPEWIEWKKDIPLKAIGQKQAISPGVVPTIRSGFGPRITLPKPSDATDKTTKRRLRRGFEFQVKFSWTGHLSLQRFRLQAQQMTEKSRA